MLPNGHARQDILRIASPLQGHEDGLLSPPAGGRWPAAQQQVLLWQQSGSQISLELTGIWRAEAARNQYGKLSSQEAELLTKQLEEAHPVFGDRQNKLTLIGLPDARDAFVTALEGALCDDEEIAAWQSGAGFSDPWPKKVRIIS